MSAAADLQVALDRLLHNQTGLARQIAKRHAKSPLAQWVVGLSWKMEKNADQAKVAYAKAPVTYSRFRSAYKQEIRAIFHALTVEREP